MNEYYRKKGPFTNKTSKNRKPPASYELYGIFGEPINGGGFLDVCKGSNNELNINCKVEVLKGTNDVGDFLITCELTKKEGIRKVLVNAKISGSKNEQEFSRNEELTNGEGIDEIDQDHFEKLIQGWVIKQFPGKIKWTCYWKRWQEMEEPDKIQQRLTKMKEELDSMKKNDTPNIPLKDPVYLLRCGMTQGDISSAWAIIGAYKNPCDSNGEPVRSALWACDDFTGDNPIFEIVGEKKADSPLDNNSTISSAEVKNIHALVKSLGDVVKGDKFLIWNAHPPKITANVFYVGDYMGQDKFQYLKKCFSDLDEIGTKLGIDIGPAFQKWLVGELNKNALLINCKNNGASWKDADTPKDKCQSGYDLYCSENEQSGENGTLPNTTMEVKHKVSGKRLVLSNEQLKVLSTPGNRYVAIGKVQKVSSLLKGKPEFYYWIYEVTDHCAFYHLCLLSTNFNWASIRGIEVDFGFSGNDKPWVQVYLENDQSSSAQ